MNRQIVSNISVQQALNRPYNYQIPSTLPKLLLTQIDDVFPSFSFSLKVFSTNNNNICQENYTPRLSLYTHIHVVSLSGILPPCICITITYSEIMLDFCRIVDRNQHKKKHLNLFRCTHTSYICQPYFVLRVSLNPYYSNKVFPLYLVTCTLS